MSNMKAYIGYTRCSSEEQKKGTSHDYQKNGIKRSSRIEDMDCLGWYSDTMTGTTTKRDGLNAAFSFLQKMQKQKHNYKKLYLIAYKTDRFGRNVEECFGTIRKFKEIGIEVNFTEEWSDYNDDNTPTLLAIRFGMAESESKKIGSRTKDGQRQMLKQGDYPHAVPFGYKRIPTGEFKKNKPVKRIVKDESVSDDLHAIFNEYLSCSASKNDLIKKYLPKIGIRKSQFYRLFDNPFYAGMFPNKHGEEPIRLNTPVYLTETQYEQMQNINKQNENGTKGKNWSLNIVEQESKYYLKGVLKCLNTGGTMTSTKVEKQNGNVYEYYQTARAKTKQVIPIGFAHTLVENMVNEIQLDDEMSDMLEREFKKLLNEKLRASKIELVRIQNDIVTNQKRIDNIANQFADGAIDSDTFKELNDRFRFQQNALVVRQAQIETVLNETEQPALQALKFIKSVGVVFKAASPKRKNQILKAVFPSGFKINMKNLVVQTEKINIFVKEFISSSTSYKYLKIGNEDFSGGFPLVGTQADEVQTLQTEILQHKHLIMQLVA